MIITKEVLKFTAYFEQPETKIEQFYVRRDRHLTFIGWALWRLTVIELCKLFGDSENQKFNILKLLRKVDRDGDYRSLKFNQKTLADFREREQQLQLVIDEISRLRDTLFAHTDRDPFEQIDTFITSKDCFALVELAEDVIRTLAGTYLDTDYVANTLYFDSKNFDFIHQLAILEQDENIAIAEQTQIPFKELFGYEPFT